jgi:uncharacterized phiE125 gp8 family phage protein
MLVLWRVYMATSSAGENDNAAVHTLIPLTDFKAILSADDREDALSRFCLVTATYAIEQYCRRSLLRRRYVEWFACEGDGVFWLREYPVRKVLGVLKGGARREELGEGILVEPDFYRVLPDLEGETGEEPEDTVYSLLLSPALFRGRGLAGVKVVYRAGYSCGKVGDPYGVPPDLAAACLELAAWNMARYRGKRIGMTGKEELSMPEHVRFLLEPYKRRMI